MDIDLGLNGWPSSNIFMRGNRLRIALECNLVVRGRVWDEGDFPPSPSNPVFDSLVIL